MHHGDAGYDVHDPELTEGQRAIVEFSPEWSVSLHTTLLLPSAAAAAVASAAGRGLLMLLPPLQVQCQYWSGA